MAGRQHGAVVMRRLPVMLPLLLIAALGLVRAAKAEVHAEIDRSDIYVNESFVLTVTYRGYDDPDPDFSVLDSDFQILNRDRQSRVRMANNAYFRELSWQLTLRPRKTGPATIPALEVAGESSTPIDLKVQDARVASHDDLFVQVDISRETPYVQAELIYTTRVYVGLTARSLRLSDPKVTGVDAIVSQLGNDRRYTANIDGRSYLIVERRYSIFPQQSGSLVIEPLELQAQVIEDVMRSRPREVKSEAIAVQVQPIPPRPAGVPDGPWLPARRLSLEDNWDEAKTDGLEAGEPFTRVITVKALGLMPTQIPAPPAEVPDGVRSYFEQPTLTDSVTDEGIEGVRTDRAAVVPQHGGRFVLPQIRVPWWNISEEKWEVASVPQRVLNVAASALAPAAAAGQALRGAPGEAVTAMPWQTLAAGFAVLWVLTAGGWFWSSRRADRPSRRSRKAKAGDNAFERQRQALRRLRATVRRGSGEEIAGALMSWSRQRWPEHPPAGLSELAARLSPVVAREIEALSRSLYGRSAEAADWSPEVLQAHLNELDRVDRPATHADSGLEPLYHG